MSGNSINNLSGLAASAPSGSFSSFALLDPTGATRGITSTDGRLLATTFLPPVQQPINPVSTFRPGANGFLLAEVDFDILGPGTANFSFITGEFGVVVDGVEE